MTAAATVQTPPPESGIVSADGAWPWIADLGDGTFRNPILWSDFSDPDAIRHGDDFYLTASSFTRTPGLPILHSRDLVNWHVVNHAVQNLPHPRYEQAQPGCGIWAPSLRVHAGQFWIFFAMPDEGIYLTTAPHPAAEWSPPRLVQPGKGLIDPCPLWDDDGRAYLVHAYAGSRSGLRHILRVCPMAPDGSRLLGEGQVVFHTPERQPVIEGPKFLKRDGWYFILAPAGGVATGWQAALRARTIYGPYEDRVVLHQGGTTVNGPHQGALIDLANGEWWFIHFQDAGLYGRILHLQPAAWRDGWPVIGMDRDGDGIGEPVLRCKKPAAGCDARPGAPQATDEFDGDSLGRQWHWLANHRPDWYSLRARPGWLRLFAQEPKTSNLADLPNLLLQRFPARSFGAETELDLVAAERWTEAGLAIVGRAHAAVAVRRAAGRSEILFRKGGAAGVIASASANRIRLRARVESGGRCAFGYAVGDGAFVAAPETFQAQAGEWVGAAVGIYSIRGAPSAGGYVDFDCLRFSAA